MSESDLPLRERAWLLGFNLRKRFHRCPECRRRGHLLPDGYRWRDDKVAQMLGVAAFGCSTCGHGAVEARDRLAGVSDE